MSPAVYWYYLQQQQSTTTASVAVPTPIPHVITPGEVDGAFLLGSLLGMVYGFVFGYILVDARRRAKRK